MDFHRGVEWISIGFSGFKGCIEFMGDNGF